MKKSQRGFTIVETLIAITILAIAMGSILGSLRAVLLAYHRDLAMVKVQATAKTITEQIVRSARHGKEFTIIDSGNELTVTRYNDATDVFVFDNGDGVDKTYEDNVIKKNGQQLGTNIVKITGENVFQELEQDQQVGVVFGVRHQGTAGNYKEVRIDTQVTLRN